MVFSTVDLTPCIGTEIRCDKATLLGGEHAEEIRDVLIRRGVVVFPKVGMTDDEQIAFSETLGALQNEPGESRVFKVSLDPKESTRANGLRGSFFWHIDGTTDQVPIFASILGVRRLAPVGGETEFCNTSAAYDALPDEEKAAIDDLTVHHSSVSNMRYVDPEMPYELYLRLRERGADLPLVWKHHHGGRSLILGATAEYVHDRSYEDSLDVLMRLRDWATERRFVYRHRWSEGDLVAWDNTGVMHRVIPYAADCGRLMHRTTLAGIETFRGALRTGAESPACESMGMGMA